MAKKKAASGRIGDDLRSVFEEVAGLVDAFFRDPRGALKGSVPAHPKIAADLGATPIISP
jgi:hypothetical protein